MFDFKHFLDALNVKKHCEEYKVGLWGCPQFLFVLMGIVIIIAILATYVVAQRYTEPEISALIAMGITVFLFVIGNSVVASFELIAEDSKAKSEFISIVSHELRDPLASMRWQLEMLEDSRLNLSEHDRQETFDLLGKQREKMSGIVSDMLAAHRMEDQMARLSSECFSLVELTDVVLKGYQEKVKQSESAISVDIDGVLPEVCADKKKIQMVLEHLVDNALKYGKSGQKIGIKIGIDRGGVHWSITDQGVGIPAEDRKNIFGKFFRARNVTSRQIDGIGLGLYIVRLVVEKSKGRVGFESHESAGSTFWFTLPAYR
ncbi:MAG: HAMP domain-containing histidine kinase [Candidatus Niyogibacteria bacterium]|nr:HAMP domain-containing histidine kinase [Candidatus Niyogibacteria bacterium]